MFFKNSNDPRTQLQARLNSESRAQHAGDRSCDETNFSDSSSGTTVPGGNGSDRTKKSARLFSTGTQNSASGTSAPLGRTPTRSRS